MSNNRIRDQFAFVDSDRFHDVQAPADARESAPRLQLDLFAGAGSEQPQHEKSAGASSREGSHLAGQGHAGHSAAAVRAASAHFTPDDDTAAAIPASDLGLRSMGNFGATSFAAPAAYNGLSTARATGDAFGISHDIGVRGGGGGGANPDVAQITGQLWFGAQGQTGATSTGYSDNHIGHIDSDGGGRLSALINTEGVQQGFQCVGMDTSNGLYFALNGDHTLRSGHLSTTNQLGESTQIQETQTQFGAGVTADEVNAFAVDPVNDIVLHSGVRTAQQHHRDPEGHLQSGDRHFRLSLQHLHRHDHRLEQGADVEHLDRPCAQRRDGDALRYRQPQALLRRRRSRLQLQRRAATPGSRPRASTSST